MKDVEKRVQIHDRAIDDLYQCIADLQNDNLELHRRIAELERYVKQLKQCIISLHKHELSWEDIENMFPDDYALGEKHEGKHH
jgi:exonuclease VII small subunit